MSLFTYIILITICLAILIALLWRLTSRRYELPCPAWLYWMVEFDNPFTKTNRAESIIEHLDLEPGMTLLDAGCGPGRLTIPAAKRVGSKGHIVAMDVQDEMLLRTRKKSHAEDLVNIEFLHAKIGDGKLGKNRFDRALLVTVLGEIPDRDKALKEILDSLKPGGILSITEVVFDPHFQSRSKVSHLAFKAGFEIKSVFGNRLAFTMNVRKPFHNRGKI